MLFMRTRFVRPQLHFVASKRTYQSFEGYPWYVRMVPNMATRADTYQARAFAMVAA